MISSDLACILLTFLISYVTVIIFNKVVLPFIIKKRTKEIEKNPKWITSRITDLYYGFSDIDFILAECPFGGLPKFRLGKDHKRLELLIPNDTQIRELDDIAKVALIGKIKIKYGLYFPDKPLHWLSILCYLLDGGDIKIKDKKDKKPVDDLC